MTDSISIPSHMRTSNLVVVSAARTLCTTCGSRSNLARSKFRVLLCTSSSVNGSRPWMILFHTSFARPVPPSAFPSSSSGEKMESPCISAPPPAPPPPPTRLPRAAAVVSSQRSLTSGCRRPALRRALAPRLRPSQRGAVMTAPCGNGSAGVGQETARPGTHRAPDAARPTASPGLRQRPRRCKGKRREKRERGENSGRREEKGE